MGLKTYLLKQKTVFRLFYNNLFIYLVGLFFYWYTIEMDITAKNARKSKHSETIMTWSMMSHQRIVIIALELLFILICLYLVTAYVYYIKFR